ncbi:glutamyl-Q tRNA(Asp) synthetase [Rubricella aquisinus]|uniref:Glutamyl-Q tRNA(Asp) synthetase n=1 Tax=Rubricella aquisinus TaxID=2028108 RepID=A0A840WYU2_9RHOB|nr:tRNA glutamyl-Q(34) synthetase GluQRS [Rubricella aquisinus]MBB5514845.1 glutamyl-Q tRNA(Asp) synthetase [Rubricella aquisinus]
MSSKRVERFAPSPTGLLHLGHGFSALTAADGADRFLLRIEDIDRARCRPAYVTALFEDLAWLGLTWETPVLRQSERRAAYDAAVARLTELGLTYPCTCTRGDIKAALSAPQEGAPLHGPDGLIYPGTCRHAGRDAEGAAIRLDMARAVAITGPLQFKELDNPDGPNGTVTVTPDHMIREIGDIVLARRDIGTSYHIAVTVDDAEQGITHVTRGQDLFTATPIHRLLQVLLGLPEPIYRHHRLIRDDQGKRLAKRDDARALRAYREAGMTPAAVIRLMAP